MNLILSHRQTLAALLTAHRDATAALLAAVRSGHDLVSTPPESSCSDPPESICSELSRSFIRLKVTHSEVLDYIRHQYRPTMVRVHEAIWHAIVENDADKYVRYALAEVRDDSTVDLRLADADTVAASVFVWCQRSGLNYRPHGRSFAADVLQRIGSDVYRVVDVGDDDMTAWARHEVYVVGSAFMARRIGWDEYHAAMVRYQPYIHDQNIVPVRG